MSMGYAPVVPCAGNIQAAITAAILKNIRFTIDAGANDVTISLNVLFGEPAGTAHVAIAPPVGDQAADQKHGYSQVPVKKIALGLMYLFQLLV